MQLFRKNYSLTVLPAAVLLTLGVLYLSCSKKQNSLAVADPAYINIFNASHVYDSMQKRRNVYLSGYDTSSITGAGSLNFWNSYELPSAAQVQPVRVDRPIRYYIFVAGSQRVRFADTLGTIVADSSLNFSSGGNYTLYLADDTTRLSPPYPVTRSGAVRLFSFPEEQTSTPGKVRLRYIDLTPDVDTLNGYFFTSTGGKFTSGATPNALTYGTASAYYDIDTTGLVVGGQMLLRMFRKKDTTRFFTQIPVPPTPGRTYTVLIFGNAGQLNCRFSVKQPDGTTKEKTITYSPNMSGLVRTVN